MLTIAKRNLINECIKLSREIPDRVFYGFIDKNGDTFQYSYQPIVELKIAEGCKVYCKAQNGQLIL